MDEQTALLIPGSYGGSGESFADWATATLRLSQAEGNNKHIQVFSILDPYTPSDFYCYLSTMTQGICLSIKNEGPATISKITIDCLLTWMGVEKPGTDENALLPAQLIHYHDVAGIAKVEREDGTDA